MATAAAALPVRVVGQYGEAGPVPSLPRNTRDSAGCWLGSTMRIPKKSKFTTGAKNKSVSHNDWPASRRRFTVMVMPIQMNGSAVISRMARNFFSEEESGETFAACSKGSR